MKIPWISSVYYLALIVGVVLSYFQFQQAKVVGTTLIIGNQSSSTPTPSSLSQLSSSTKTLGLTSPLVLWKSRLPSEWLLALESSHFVELDHCIGLINKTSPIGNDILSSSSSSSSNFTAWTAPIVDRAVERVITRQPYNSRINNNDTINIDNNWRKEWTWQLLEMKATHAGWCDFDRYLTTTTTTTNTRNHDHWTLHEWNVAAGRQLRYISQTVSQPSDQARLVICIVTYQDAMHLQALIEAIHLPHHFIVIHLEASAYNTAFEGQVQDIAHRYDNVVVVRFGTILYKTDSISHVNLQLMKWLSMDLQLDYDYHISLGGAVYPLFSAAELARHLQASSGNVWMGALTHKGMTVHHPQWNHLWKKRLVTSSQEKVTVKVGYVFGGDEDLVPDWMNEALRHKATSGNQAVFSRHVVQELLQNSRAKQILAMAKYGCCCCIEERSWIAAMDVLGYLQEAKQRRSMFQWWGGDNHLCRGSMNNAVLDLNPDRCYRTEDPWQNDTTKPYLWGNTTWSHLQRTKQQGVIFARKFRSDHPGSVALRNKIQNELHQHD